MKENKGFILLDLMLGIIIFSLIVLLFINYTELLNVNRKYRKLFKEVLTLEEDIYNELIVNPEQLNIHIDRGIKNLKYLEKKDRYIVYLNNMERDEYLIYLEMNIECFMEGKKVDERLIQISIPKEQGNYPYGINSRNWYF